MFCNKEYLNNKSNKFGLGLQKTYFYRVLHKFNVLPLNLVRFKVTPELKVYIFLYKYKEKL